MRLTESGAWNILAKATNEAGLDKAAVAFVRAENARTFRKRTTVAGVIALAAAAAWYSTRPSRQIFLFMRPQPPQA